MPGIIIVVVISIMIMNHYCVTMITPMVAVVVVIMIVMIGTNCHNSESGIIGRTICIGIRGIIGHIYG